MISTVACATALRYKTWHPMRLWLSKSAEVPLREQLVTQIILGIVSNDLQAEERLPSTRELARRYKIHSNTVSAAYRELAKRGWVEFRKGSGVYVRRRAADENLTDKLELDQLISLFFRTARERGHSLGAIQSSLQRWSALQPPDHFLVIESDVELRRLLMAEIEAATGARVLGTDLEEATFPEALLGAVPVALYSQARSVRERLPAETDLVAVHSNSVPESLKGQRLPPRDAFIAVVSCWPEFLRRARAVLIAAGVDADALSFRDGREPGWEKGLSLAALVITDSIVACQLPPECNVRVFPIVSEASRVELRDYVERFFS